LLPDRRPDRPRWITPEPLNVSPELVGLPLASPWRRAAAMGVDVVVVGLLSGVSGLWLLGGLALVLLQLRSRRGATSGPRLALGWVAAVLIGLLALQEAQSWWTAWRHPAQAAAAAAAEAEDARADAQAERDESRLGPDPSASPAAHAASGAGAPAATDAQRIARLEAELAEARRPRPLRQQLSRLVDDIGLGLGWGIVYFSLLPAWWGGQTVGKKLLRLRVVELTGKPMTVLRCLKRYGGYAAGMATGGLGFAQVLWDPNRQGLHDKAAHTAVVDLRAPRLGAAPAAAATAPPSTAPPPP